MFSTYIKDSFLFWNGSSSNIIDFLEEKFIQAGWVVDLKKQEEFFDKGEGMLYPTYYQSIKTSQNTSDNGYSGFRGLNMRAGCYASNIIYNYVKIPLDILSGASYGFVGRFSSRLQGKNFKIRAYIPWYSNNNRQVYMCSSNRITDSITGPSTLYMPSGANVWAESQETINFNAQSKTLFFTHYAGYEGAYSPVIKLSPGYYDSLGNKSKELYIHSVTPLGETIYLSINLNYELLRLEFYGNLGFDNTKTVDRQPGTIKDVSSAVYEYWYIKIPESWFPIDPVDIYFIGNSSSVLINIYSNLYVNQSKYTQYFYMGQLDKFFNYNGGAVVTGTNYNRYTVSTTTTTAGNSNYYVLYEGTWYGKTIASSVSNKQGYIDLVTPSNYTTAGFNQYSGEIFVTQQVAGLNLGISDNFEYKPIGTLHNFYKHYGVTPTLPISLTINGDEFWSFPLDTNNRIAFKAVDNA